MEKITYRCPSCGKRLFDLDGIVSGRIEIKCTRCKTLTVFDSRTETNVTDKNTKESV